MDATKGASVPQNRPLRRSDRQIKEKEARELLARGEYGVLALVCEDESPYGVPLSYALIGEKIYFHCAKEGLKLDCIAREDRVCFTVVEGVQECSASSGKFAQFGAVLLP